MGKLRALFPQGALYSFGLGALSGDTQGSLLSSPHNKGPNVLGRTPARQRHQRGDWECGRILLFLERWEVPWRVLDHVWDPPQASALDLKFFLVTLTCAVEGTHMSCACEAPLTQP